MVQESCRQHLGLGGSDMQMQLHRDPYFNWWYFSHILFFKKRFYLFYY